MYRRTIRFTLLLLPVLLGGCQTSRPEAPSRNPQQTAHARDAALAAEPLRPAPPPEARPPDPAPVARAPAPAWQYLGLTEHEPNTQGLGRSHKFIGPEGLIDVFRYDLRQFGLRPILSDARTLQHFEQIKSDVVRGGVFSDLQALQDDRFELDGYKFLRSRFKGAQRGRPVITEVWLTVVNGRFMKLRVTHPIDLDQEGRDRLYKFASGVIRGMTGGPNGHEAGQSR